MTRKSKLLYAAKCHRTAKMFWLNHVEKCEPLLVFRCWISLLVIRVDLHAFCWLPLVLQAHLDILFTASLIPRHSITFFLYSSTVHLYSIFSSRFFTALLFAFSRCSVACTHYTDFLFFARSLARLQEREWILEINLNEFPSYFCMY